MKFGFARRPIEALDLIRKDGSVDLIYLSRNFERISFACAR